MSKSNLHKEKARSKRGEYGDDFNDYPLNVKKYYDRHSGSHDARIERQQKKEKDDKKNFDKLKHELVDE